MQPLYERIHDVFYDVRSLWFGPVNNFLAGVTLISTLSIILETVASLSPYVPIFNFIEYSAVFIFTLEYLARIYANKRDMFSYVFSFFGFIDLFAILPSYFSVTNLTYLKSARVLRVLRLLRMVRVAEISRLAGIYPREPEDYAHLYKLNIRIYFFALFSAVVIFGTFIYVVEGQYVEVFSNIPLGMIWAAKVILGGISEYIPTTVAGEVIGVCARFVGLALFGLLINVIGNWMRRFLFGEKEFVRE